MTEKARSEEQSLFVESMSGPSFGSLLQRRWLLVGIGNELRGDDAFGPLLARRLASAGLRAIDAGTAPENYTEAITRAKPEVLLFADATHFGGAPGSLCLMRPEEIADCGTSTHDSSLSLLLTYLAASCSAEPFILAAEPACLDFGAEPSPEIRGAIEATCVTMGRG